MKKVISWVLTIALLFSLVPADALTLTAQAASESELTFTLNSSKDGYIVSDCNESATGELVIPATYNGLPVTTIGANAFKNCTQLTAVEIPNSVKTIEYFAFGWCENLVSVEIPDSVTSLGYYAFYYCSSLTSVKIGASVADMGDYTFDACNSLTEIVFYGKAPQFGSYGFDGVTATAYYYPDETWTSSVMKNYGGAITWVAMEAEPEIIASGTCGDNLTWTLDAEGTLTISGTGDMEDYDWNTMPWYSYRASIKNVVIKSDVTSIGNNAFYNHYSLTQVTIGENVTSIGSNAFANGTGLTGELIIPDSVTSIGRNAFSYCEGLTSVTIGSSVETIGYDAFGDCTGLTGELIIPDSVTSIDGYAFHYCNGLTSLTIGSSVETIGYDAFANCTGLTGELIIPDSVTSIGWYAFSDCTGLTSVTIGNSVETIGSYAFLNCAGLTGELAIPDSVTSIGKRAFGACTSLTSIIIPNSVTSIGWGAFGGCTLLSGIWVSDGNANYSSDEFGILFNKDKTTLIRAPGGISGNYIIPDSVTSIGENAFSDCTGLTSVTIPDSVTIIDNHAFSSCKGLTSVTIPDSVTSLGECVFCFCTGLTSVTIGNSVETIGEGAFSDCRNLTSVTIPNSVTSIGLSAFANCTSLISLSIGTGVKTIGDYAFGYCRGLTLVSIPDSVINIGYRTFGNCSSLKEIYFEGSAPAMDSNAFYDVTVTAYYYPDETWKEYMLLDYGGDITWVAMEKEPEIIASGTCGDNLTWTLDEEGTLTISGTGDMTDYGNVHYDHVGAPWYSYHASIKTVIIESGVTSIGDYAFYYCTGLSSVTIGNSVKSIGSTAFGDCTALTSVTIPESVTSIGWDAFFGCISLTSVTILDSVTNIDGGAFGGCTGLAGIWVSDGNANYCSDEFGVLFNKDKTTLIQAPGGISGDYVVPNSVISIDVFAFIHCDGLTSVTIPDSVTSIGDYAFDGCSGLTWVTIGNRVETIGECAFRGCASLTSVTIPNSVTSICGGAFADCTSLISVTIPDSVTSIGNSAFRDCESLTSITIPDSVTNIGVYVFRNCTDLKEISFAGSAPVIGENVFYDVTATAYYNPDETWTEDVRQNYGGTLTWVALEQEHTCTYTATVTEPTCTEQGYTTYTCAGCGDSYIDDYTDALGHDHQHTSTTDPSCTEDGCEIFTCSRCGDTKEETLSAGGHHYGDDNVCDDCGHTASGGIPENALQLPGDEFADQDTVWIGGLPYPIQGEGENRYVALPEAEEFLMVTYTYHEGDGQDVHTQYPTGMKVYRVKDGEITHIPELDNLLQYSGSSIRITGKKGIRMITSIAKDKKTALTSKGLAGYTVVEYGTVLCFASEIPEGDGLVLGRSYARSNYAYKKGVADPVFASTKDLIQYTNVLVGFSLDQCKDDIAMRPYIILEDAAGNQVTLYGGTIYRSIGYIAYQNRNVFKPKTASYNYVWEIIHHVYGDKYDAEYKG